VVLHESMVQGFPSSQSTPSHVGGGTGVEGGITLDWGLGLLGLKCWCTGVDVGVTTGVDVGVTTGEVVTVGGLELHAGLLVSS